MVNNDIDNDIDNNIDAIDDIDLDNTGIDIGSTDNNITDAVNTENSKNNNVDDSLTSLPCRKGDYLLVRGKQFEIIRRRKKTISLTDTLSEIISKGINLVNADVVELRATESYTFSKMEVIFLAGSMWKDLSQRIGLVSIEEFHINKYPDLVGLSKDGKKVDIEFESFSANFVRHGHPAGRCNAIICWKHDWEECPDNIDVIELSKMVDENGKISSTSAINNTVNITNNFEKAEEYHNSVENIES